jgi:uncharacterized protein YegP (UPF0339 family)
MAKFEIKKNPNTGQYYWHLRADNNEIVAHGETYVRKQSCLDTVNLVKRIAPTAQIVDLTL